MAPKGIYVETFIRGSLDEVWRLTQTPEVHQRWDLRFTRIQYLPRVCEAEPQQFLYVTQLLPGISIKGTGESVGDRRGADGTASSALRFGSDQAWSLIRRGSGYWRYTPVQGGTRFLTWYDYDVRFGALGRWLNSWILRPAMGWATAWSFDRLRLWIEEGQSPEASFVMATVQTVARVTIGFVWIWHGLVPKVLFQNANERLMLAQAGLPVSLVSWIGVAEILFGFVMWCGTRWRWLYV